MPEDQPSSGLFVDIEKVHPASQLTVISLLRLFYTPQAFFQFIAVSVSCPVYTLEHLPVLIPPPVSSGHGKKLECPGHLYIRKMGARAEIRKGTESVNTYSPGIQIFYQFNLERLVSFPEEFDRFLAGERLTGEFRALAPELFHLFLDLSQVIRAEGMLQLEIVVESILYGRAYTEYHIAKQLLDRQSHKVRSAVSQHFQRFFIAVGNNHESAVRADFLS